MTRILRVTAGNFLEMFDFFLFGLYAGPISRAFFPARNATSSLLLTFAVFGAGFFMRPLGAVVLGGFVDRVGRRRGLIVTLSIMATGTVLVAFVPGYATIGIAAPLLVLLGRLLQGFSAGAELGGVSVYLAEVARPGRAGFTVAWQSASQQVAIIVAALIGSVLSRGLAPAALEAWGWRVPFVIGCLIVPLILWLRRSLPETEAFLGRTHHPSLGETAAGLARQWRIVVVGLMLVITTTVSFYMITGYTPTFGHQLLHLSTRAALAATMAIGVSNLFWLPIMGALSDRIGRLPILLAASGLLAVSAYPVLAHLAAHPSLALLIGTLLWLSFLYASYNGAMVVALTEIVPVEARTSGFSLAYSGATALSGGLTPLICTALVRATGDRASPGLWLTAAALCGFGASLGLTMGWRNGWFRSADSG